VSNLERKKKEYKVIDKYRDLINRRISRLIEILNKTNDYNKKINLQDKIDYIIYERKKKIRIKKDFINLENYIKEQEADLFVNISNISDRSYKKIQSNNKLDFIKVQYRKYRSLERISDTDFIKNQKIYNEISNYSATLIDQEINTVKKND